MEKENIYFGHLSSISHELLLMIVAEQVCRYLASHHRGGERLSDHPHKEPAAVTTGVKSGLRE